MKCEEAQQLIAGLSAEATPEIPEELSRHIRECRDCATLLAFDARLREALDTEVVAPAHILGQVRSAVAAQDRHAIRSWIESVRRSKRTMKITLSAVTAAILAVASVGFLARPAQAAEPRAKFAAMKKAVLAATKQMSQIELTVARKPDGTIGSWVVVDGQLTELQPGQMVDHGNGVYTMTMSSGDVEHLAPGQKARIEAAIAEAKKHARENGGQGTAVKTFAYINGKQVPMDEAKEALAKAGIDLDIRVDLDETHYKSIAFGQSPNMLVLTPKNGVNRRYVVQLDPKSSKPKRIVLEQNKNGKWTSLRQTDVSLRSL